MYLAARSLLPLVAMALGTWIGLGAPYVDRASSALEDARLKLRPTPPPAPPPRSPEARKARLDGPPPVDPSLLPDPTPWPQLNPSDSLSRAWLLAEGPAYPSTDGRRLLTLTFDDGPFPETTPVVLRVLAKHHVRATFFWIGRYLDGDSARAVATREVAKQVDAAGHLVGNHTHDHEHLSSLSHAQQVAQIDDGAASIERVTGKRPILFRPPYGDIDAYTEGLLRARSQTLVLWSVEAGDFHGDDSDAMVSSLTDQIEYGGGGIVLLHDFRFTSADALEKLLTWIDARRYDPKRPERMGYEVVDLPQYLRATAASPQPFASREELEKARAHGWHKQHPSGGSPAMLVSDEPVL